MHPSQNFRLRKRFFHKPIILILLPIFFCLKITILFSQGFDSITPLIPFSVSKNSAEVTQSKVWQYAGKWWAVFPISGGTYVWKLNGSTWTNVLKIASSSITKADCKAVDDVCHVFLFRNYDYTSLLVSLQYDPVTENYKLWPERLSTTQVNLDEGVETASIDVDGTGRMWLASDGISDIKARWSDPPYTRWSEPVIIASDISADDIGTVISLPLKGQIGIFWSNQNTKRLGFKVHHDGANPQEWSSDEAPASQSALDIKNGMADDHIDLAVASNGSLYAVCKTGYDTHGYPKIILLKRQPSGIWDNAYAVSDIGTKPVVVINQSLHKIKVIFTSESGSNLLYKESPLENIAFGPTFTLLSGEYDHATSTKDNYSQDLVVLASNNVARQIVGVICNESPTDLPAAPVLLCPLNVASDIPLSTSLWWEYAKNATGFRVQLSSTADFSSLLLDKNSISASTIAVNGLTRGTQYYWRVQSSNAIDTSSWSEAWSFVTTLEPAAPILISPADLSNDVATKPSLTWGASLYAETYDVQISDAADFSGLIHNESNITDTSRQVNTVLNNSTRYYWRVRAANSIGYGDWSQTWSFTTMPPVPGIPLLVAPATGTTTEENTLVWRKTKDATSYRLQFSTTADFSTTIIDKTALIDTSYSVTGLENASTYFWRVLAENVAGSGEWSETWNFTVQLPPTGLAGYWKLDDGSGATSADHSENGNNGNIVGSPLWTTGIYGSALMLSGADQYITVPDDPSLDISEAITLAAWIRPEKLAAQKIIIKGDSKTADGYELSLLSTGKVTFRLNQYSSDTYKLNSNALYAINGTWIHVAATYNGSSIRIYINGVQDKSQTFTAAPSIGINAMPVTIGASADATSEFKGALDEVRIYNYALTGPEVYDLATSSVEKINQAGRLSQSNLVTVNEEQNVADTEVLIGVFPNPVINTLFVSLPPETDHSISISDTQGRILFQTYTPRGTDQLTVPMDSLCLETGLYILSIQSPHSMTMKKFIKK